MKRLSATLFMAFIAISLSAQDNMVAFRHLSIDAEVGLHGIGLELAMPIHKNLVFKTGFNWVPSGDLFFTDVKLDTYDIPLAQLKYDEEHKGHEFSHYNNGQTVVKSGIKLGLNNYKAMINWYPFKSGRLYLAGGVYYTPSHWRDDPFICLSGNAETQDWETLKELNRLRAQEGDEPLEMVINIGGNHYAVVDRDGAGYLEAEFTMDPLKYFVGFGIGRCVPNKVIGLQFETGAMVFRNSRLSCRNPEAGSTAFVAERNDTNEILEHVEKYPVYPQATLRLCFRMF